MEEHATKEHALAVRRIRALEIQEDVDYNHLCRLVTRQMRLEITMHTLQHAPVDCSLRGWSSNLHASEDELGLCVIPVSITHNVLEPPLSYDFDISTLHRADCPFCTRPFGTSGFYALGCAHIYHFSCLVRMIKVRSTCMVCTCRIDPLLYTTFGLNRYRPDISSSFVSPPPSQLCDPMSSSNAPPPLS